MTRSPLAVSPLPEQRGVRHEREAASETVTPAASTASAADSTASTREAAIRPSAGR